MDGMDQIRVRGGRPLQGEIRISGAKNAALPLMAASLLTNETLNFANQTSLDDCRTISLPTLILCGEKTTEPDRRVTEILHREMPNSEFKIASRGVAVLTTLCAAPYLAAPPGIPENPLSVCYPALRQWGRAAGRIAPATCHPLGGFNWVSRHRHGQSQERRAWSLGQARNRRNLRALGALIKRTNVH